MTVGRKAKAAIAVVSRAKIIFFVMIVILSFESVRFYCLIVPRRGISISKIREVSFVLFFEGSVTGEAFYMMSQLVI